MSTTFVQPGDVIDTPATRDVTAGEYMLVTDDFGGVCAHSAAQSATVSLHTIGVFSLTKADAGDVFAIGAPIYGGDVDGVQSAPDSAASAKIAVAVQASGGGVATVVARLVDPTPA